jgi:hypothetical protein
MNALSARSELRSLESLPDDYLGPAVVVACEEPATVVVAPPGGSTVRAEMALALPYRACVGDVLLVIGRRDAWYVIGVLEGRGKTELSVQGDLTLHAVGGIAEIAGDKGVRVRGDRVELHARELRTVADSAIETVVSLVKRVADTLLVYARTSNTVVEEGAYTQAKTATIRTEETMSINGKQIHLG